MAAALNQLGHVGQRNDPGGGWHAFAVRSVSMLTRGTAKACHPTGYPVIKHVMRLQHDAAVVRVASMLSIDDTVGRMFYAAALTMAEPGLYVLAM